MEALVHNLNTMHSRAGAQTPFSSVNYGMDTSPEGRMVIRNMLLATEAGLGYGETPIFPVQIFTREGRRQLQSRATRTTTCSSSPCTASAPSGCSPTSASWTRRSTLQYYKPGTPETEIAYMGCRTRVMGNVYDPDREVTPRPRQPDALPPSTCPRLAIRAKGDHRPVLRPSGPRSWRWCIGQLDERFEIQARKKVYNCAVPHGAGRVDRLRKAGAGRRSSARCSSTAR